MLLQENGVRESIKGSMERRNVRIIGNKNNILGLEIYY